MPFSTIPLHPLFGLEVRDVDLSRITNTSGYPQLRELFESHSLLLFRDQALDDDSHFSLARLFGPIENRQKGAWGDERTETSMVTNLGPDGTLVSPTDSHILNLKANQLWHTDSTFLPVPALANIITARTVSGSGGETEFASTRAAWRDLPVRLKNLARKAVLTHRYSHSRSKIDPDLANQDLFTMWPEQAWRAVWPNPVTGDEALYIASHACGVSGMDPDAGQQLIDELIAFATRPRYVYSHSWSVGDVLIWDERATLHRGRPWPYTEERTLSSLCVTASTLDGLDQVRP